MAYVLNSNLIRFSRPNARRARLNQILQGIMELLNGKLQDFDIVCNNNLYIVNNENIIMVNKVRDIYRPLYCPALIVSSKYT